MNKEVTLLEMLRKICRGPVSIVIDSHRNGGRSVDDYLDYQRITPREEIPVTIQEEMKQQDTVVYVRFFLNPDMVEYKTVFHWNINLALEAAVHMAATANGAERFERHFSTPWNPTRYRKY